MHTSAARAIQQAIALAVLFSGAVSAEPQVAACDSRMIHRLLEVMENDIVPKTQKGVREGNKVFGAAILRKGDLSLVLAESNNEIENPLWHGEVHAIKKLYEMPRSQRPDPKKCVFLATHEPCPLCLSAITWAGYDNFYYLFSYEDSRDSFNIPHDLRILKEVFKLGPGEYAQENHYWKSYDLMAMINSCAGESRQGYLKRVERLRQTYAEMSEIYQKSKETIEADIPLK